MATQYRHLAQINIVATELLLVVCFILLLQYVFTSISFHLLIIRSWVIESTNSSTIRYLQFLQGVGVHAAVHCLQSLFTACDILLAGLALMKLTFT